MHTIIQACTHARRHAHTHPRTCTHSFKRSQWPNKLRYDNLTYIHALTHLLTHTTLASRDICINPDFTPRDEHCVIFTLTFFIFYRRLGTMCAYPSLPSEPSRLQIATRTEQNPKHHHWHSSREQTRCASAAGCGGLWLGEAQHGHLYFRDL